MDMDHIAKQVDWLDTERRKDNTRIGSLEERLKGLEGNVPALVQQIKELNSELTRLGALTTRMEGYDEALHLSLDKDVRKRARGKLEKALQIRNAATKEAAKTAH